MCNRILKNTEWYRKVSQGKLVKAQQELIYQAFHQGTIPKSTWEFLKTEWPCIPTFYSLPKVHKNLTKPPGRPIISKCGSLTEKASILVDTHLHPHVLSLTSYLKDTIQTIDEIHVPLECG